MLSNYYYFFLFHWLEWDMMVAARVSIFNHDIETMYLDGNATTKEDLKNCHLQAAIPVLDYLSRLLCERGVNL